MACFADLSGIKMRFKILLNYLVKKEANLFIIQATTLTFAARKLNLTFKLKV